MLCGTENTKGQRNAHAEFAPGNSHALKPHQIIPGAGAEKGSPVTRLYPLDGIIGLNFKHTVVGVFLLLGLGPLGICLPGLLRSALARPGLLLGKGGTALTAKPRSRRVCGTAGGAHDALGAGSGIFGLPFKSGAVLVSVHAVPVSRPAGAVIRRAAIRAHHNIVLIGKCLVAYRAFVAGIIGHIIPPKLSY